MENKMRVPMSMEINEFGNDECGQSVFTYVFEPCNCCEDISADQCSNAIRTGSCPKMRGTN